MKFPVLIFLLIGAVSGLAPRRADACTAPPGVLLREVVPRDGATEVPTNARVVIRDRRGRDQLDPAFTLRARNGDAVPSTLQRSLILHDEVFVLTPTISLAASTSYEVLGGEPAPAPCGPGGCNQQLAVIATFTTGAGPDTTPPSGADAQVTTEYIGDLGMCSPGSAVRHDVSVLYALIEPTLLFNYYNADGELVAGPLPRRVPVGRLCGDELSTQIEADLGTDTFTIRAVDLAGNEEAAGHQLRGRPCSDFEDGGCSASPGAGGVLGVLGALVLASRRRRATPRG